MIRPTFRLITADVREGLVALPSESVQCVVTSPPYWGLRDYGIEGQLGLEPTYHAYIEAMVAVFREVRRVLHPRGTLWLNLGDTYAGSWCNRSHTRKREKYGDSQAPQRRTDLPAKNLIGIPWRVALALQDDGWILRNDIIWHKSNAMPESPRDRLARDHEYLFLLARSTEYRFNADAIREPHAEKTLRHRGNGSCGRAEATDELGLVASGNWAGLPREINPAGAAKRTVWRVTGSRYKPCAQVAGSPDNSGAHFATYPPELIRPCILAGSSPGDTVLDPFSGVATTGVVALELGRNYLGIEINEAYNEAARKRLMSVPLLLGLEPDRRGGKEATEGAPHA